MRFLLKVVALSLLICRQAALGQPPASESQAPTPPNPCLPSGIKVVSNASAVDATKYAGECYSISDDVWDFLMPKEAEYPRLAKGQVGIQFEVQRDGKIRHHSMAFVLRSGNSALDHAAWKAIKKSRYPPIPKEIKGPYLAMRFCFLYNLQSPKHPGNGNKAP